MSRSKRLPRRKLMKYLGLVASVIFTLRHAHKDSQSDFVLVGYGHFPDDGDPIFHNEGPGVLGKWWRKLMGEPMELYGTPSANDPEFCTNPTWRGDRSMLAHITGPGAA